MGRAGSRLSCARRGSARTTAAAWDRRAVGGDTARGGRVRRPGAGRPRLTESDPELWERWRRRWIRIRAGIRARRCGGARRELAEHRECALRRQDIRRPIGRPGSSCGARASVARELQDAGGKDDPDRDAQLRHINERHAALAADQPVISVDAKRAGREFKAVGREDEPMGGRSRSAATTSKTRIWARDPVRRARHQSQRGDGQRWCHP